MRLYCHKIILSMIFSIVWPRTHMKMDDKYMNTMEVTKTNDVFNS